MNRPLYRSALRSIQQSARNIVAAMPEFQGVKVLAEEQKDFQTELEKMVEGVGLFATVLTVGGRAAYSDTSKPYFTNIEVVVRIFENVAVNRGGTNPQYRTGQELAELAAIGLHCESAEGIAECFVARDVTLANDNLMASFGIVCWDAKLSTQGGTTTE